MTPLLRRQSYGLRRIRILEAANRGAWSRHSSLCPSRSSLESRELSLGMPSRRLWLEESLCARLDGDHSTVAGFAPPLTLRRKSMIGSRTVYSLEVLLPSTVQVPSLPYHGPHHWVRRRMRKGALPLPRSLRSHVLAW